MDPKDIDHLRQQTARSAAVAKLQHASRDLLGGALLFLACKDNEVAEILPSGNDDELPEFCRLYRSSADGLECCMTCRSLMAFGACYRGTIEYSCHGGVRILASPALQQPGAEEHMVVASCAFSRPDREEGWREFRDHARGLGIDLRKLRAAYERMPVLTDDKRRIAQSLVEIAGSLLNDLLGRKDEREPPPSCGASPEGENRENLDQLIASALYFSQAQSAHQGMPPHGSLLVERVKEMISRDPSMPFTLKNVAKTARISPNHLSTVFHQFAGETFSEFLLGQRIQLAKRLLRDLSLNVEEVARRSGFPNASYFSRRFRLHTGSPPTVWRNKL